MNNRFPYNGMTPKQIGQLCSNNRLQRFFLPAPYWTPELYSKGKYLRQYAYYPPFLPLCISTSHGVGEYLSPLQHELACDAPMQFFLNAKVIRKWKELSNKPAFPLFSPEVFYRRKENICPSANARGTIAFPVHSTPDCDEISDKQIYIKKLKNLPNKYQPVTVCLHYHDINKDLHHEYIKAGLPVVTAGNSSDYRFIERFYELLRHFKYSTSNDLVSALYYSVEMGIPFFLLGKTSIFFNKTDDSIPAGRFVSPMTAEKRKVIGIFSKRVSKVTSGQKMIASEKLGLNTGLSRMQTSILFYQALIQWLFSIRSTRWMLSLFKLSYQILISR